MESIILRRPNRHLPRSHPARGRWNFRLLLTKASATANHTPQGDGKERPMFTSRPCSKPTHTPQGDGKEDAVFLEPTHAPQGDGKSLVYTWKKSRSEPTHTPQGDGKVMLLLSLMSGPQTNSHPVRGRKKSIFSISLRLSPGTNSHPARGQTNRRNFSALHRCGRKVPSAFLIFCTVFQPGTAAEPFSECKTETPETKGRSL